MRAAIADVHGKLDHKNWEATAAAFMPQYWFTDCKSVRDTLCRSVMAKMADKRLQIEIAGLRQNLWRQPGEAIGDPTFLDEPPANPTDVVRWVDTDVMIADPLTKTMEPDKLVQALDTNNWDVSQPIEAVLKKRAKQLSRRKNLDTWERVDNQVTTYQVVDARGPDWEEVVRRTTKDLRTGDVIDDDFQIASRDADYVTRVIPKGPKDIRTVFYFPKDKEDEDEVNTAQGYMSCIHNIRLLRRERVDRDDGTTTDRR